MTHCASASAGLRLDDLALCDPDILAAAAQLSEQRARQLIAAGVPEDDALARAADDALGYARHMVADHVRQQHRQLALDAVIDAYGGNTYRLLRDRADTVGASLAYVDWTTVEAHLERSLSDAEWAAANEQFHAMDFDDAVGDQGRFRTDWIETILERAGVPGQRLRSGPPVHEYRRAGCGMTRAFDDGFDEAAVTAEQSAELRGEALVIQMLLHQLCAQLTTFAVYPHDQLRRAALDLAAEHVRSTETLLGALDDVLDPRLDPAGRDEYARYLKQRIERGRHALADAS